MPELSPALLQGVVQRLKYKWFEDRPNIIGIRSTNYAADKFNDRLAVVWKQPNALTSSMSTLQKQVALNQWFYKGEDGKALAEDGKDGKNTRWAIDDHNRTVGTYRMRTWIITTVPGVYYLENPANTKGTAVYKPGQYIDAYTLGYHKQKTDHRALLQTGNITVYRDIDKDRVAEETTSLDTGLFGCNIHRSNSSGVTSSIGQWSAGCQVFQVKTDHDQLLRIADNYVAAGIKKFSYTLLKEADLG